MSKIGDIWFRYDDVLYASLLDEHENRIGKSRLYVVLTKYRVIKVTPKGVVLDTGRRVLDSSKKRFAHPDLIQAKQSFLARKSRQISILSEQLARAEEAMRKGRELAPFTPAELVVMNEAKTLETLGF